MVTDGLFQSMFHRRIALLLGLCVVPVALIWTQLIRLTMLEGPRLRDEAESKLIVTQWAPTTRGRILDRKGRVLAQDRPSWDVALNYSVISGQWAESQAARAARGAYRDTWSELGPGQRNALIERFKGPFEAHVDAAWDRLAEQAGATREALLDEAHLAETRVESMVEHLNKIKLDQEKQDLLERGREITTEIEAELEATIEKQRIREQVIGHPIMRGVDDELAFGLMSLADQMTTLELPGVREPVEVALIPGLSVVGSSKREYPFASVVVDVDTTTLPKPLATEGHASVGVDGVATHVLGWMGSRANVNDETRRHERIRSDPAFAARVLLGDDDLGAYRAGDPAPRAGVEWSQEHLLRGLRGLRVTNLETGVDDVTQAVPGADIRLTIDAMLQARIQAAMDPSLGLAAYQHWHAPSPDPISFGEPFYGAAVVIEVDTGEVLALVTTPSFTRQQLADDPDAIFKEPITAPAVNKAVQKPYPPGSIAKAIVISEAISRGKLGLHERIECTGHLLPNREDILRCWIWRERYSFNTHTSVLGHHPDATEALMVSCNIFSYTVGRRLGPEGIANVYRDFGVETDLDLGIGRVYKGAIGRAGDGSDLTISDATMMGMGQGPVAWTPLHAAAALATLAQGGFWIEPRLVDDGRSPEVRDIELDPRAVGAALKGLYNVVNDSAHGTGHSINYGGVYGRGEIFNAPGVDVWGKTGTAEAPVLKHDPDGEGPEPEVVLRANDHSWFAALVAPEGERPRYAICVLMEHAGSGGRVSGPIANQIIHSLIAEGYLEP